MATQAQGLSLFEAARRMGVPFQREAEPLDREVSTGGMKLHYLDWGAEGRVPVVFLHGNAQQAHSWDFISLALCDSYRCLAPDARGHGDSDWAPQGEYTVDAYVQDLAGFVDELGLDQFILVGHSMGGRTCYVYTSMYPEKVKALAIVDSGPRAIAAGISRMDSFKQLPDLLDSYEEFTDRVQEYTGRSREQVAGALKHTIRQLPTGKWTWKYDKLLRTPGGTPAGWAPEKLWECIEKITCPTFIVRGEQSDVFAVETMDRMLQIIPGSSAVTVPNAGHLVAGDNPSALVEALRGWLATVA